MSEPRTIWPYIYEPGLPVTKTELPDWVPPAPAKRPTLVIPTTEASTK